MIDSTHDDRSPLFREEASDELDREGALCARGGVIDDHHPVGRFEELPRALRGEARPLGDEPESEAAIPQELGVERPHVDDEAICGRVCDLRPTAEVDAHRLEVQTDARDSCLDDLVSDVEFGHRRSLLATLVPRGAPRSVTGIVHLDDECSMSRDRRSDTR